MYDRLIIKLSYENHFGEGKVAILEITEYTKNHWLN